MLCYKTCFFVLPLFDPEKNPARKNLEKNKKMEAPFSIQGRAGCQGGHREVTRRPLQHNNTERNKTMSILLQTKEGVIELQGAIENDMENTRFEWWEALRERLNVIGAHDELMEAMEGGQP